MNFTSPCSREAERAAKEREARKDCASFKLPLTRRLEWDCFCQSLVQWWFLPRGPARIPPLVLGCSLGMGSKQAPPSSCYRGNHYSASSAHGLQKNKNQNTWCTTIEVSWSFIYFTHWTMSHSTPPSVWVNINSIEKGSCDSVIIYNIN